MNLDNQSFENAKNLSNNLVLPQNVVIFPHNNPFAKLNKKPVVLSAFSYLKYSKHRDNICVITPYVNQVEDCVKSIVVPKEDSKSKPYTKHVLSLLANLNVKSLEVHQNIKLASEIAKHFPHIKVSLIKHNDYLINRIQEKFYPIKLFFQIRYLKNIYKVFCISQYVQDSLIKNYSKYQDKFILLYNNYGHLDYNFDNIDINNKENTIIFVGKLNKRKGANLLLQVIPKILAKYPNYKVVIISAIFSSKNKYAKLLGKFIKNKSNEELIKNKQLVLLSNLSNSDVFAQLIKAKIAIVSTLKPEPFGLVALEYALAKCLVVSSGSGGLKEINGNYAIYLNHLNANDLFIKLDEAISNYDEYKQKAQDGFDFSRKKFNIMNLINVIDEFRSEDV